MNRRGKGVVWRGLGAVSRGAICTAAEIENPASTNANGVLNEFQCGMDTANGAACSTRHPKIQPIILQAQFTSATPTDSSQFRLTHFP